MPPGWLAAGLVQARQAYEYCVLGGSIRVLSLLSFFASRKALSWPQTTTTTSTTHGTAYLGAIMTLSSG
jgi:hypothetical protein